MYISKLKGLGARVSVHPAGNLDCVLSSQAGNISVRRKNNISFIQVARLVTAHYHPVIQDEDIVITADVDGFIMSPRILDPLQKASSFWVWGYDYSRILGVEFQIPLLGKNHFSFMNPVPLLYLYRHERCTIKNLRTHHTI